MGLDFDQLFPNRFLKAGEFKGKDVTLTVAAVDVEELEGDKGKQVKGIITFKETKKQLVLNKTNGLCLRGMFGRDTGAWVGKRVTFWPAPIDFGDAEIAIRVRGSPDLEADLEIEIKLARKKARTVKMFKTGPRGANGAAKKEAPPAEQALPAEPPPDASAPWMSEQ
jgi:hypothetical protein